MCQRPDKLPIFNLSKTFDFRAAQHRLCGRPSTRPEKSDALLLSMWMTD
jgi:hypothetical protein